MFNWTRYKDKELDGQTGSIWSFLANVLPLLMPSKKAGTGATKSWERKSKSNKLNQFEHDTFLHIVFSLTEVEMDL